MNIKPMIKKTIYLGNPYYVGLRNNQLELRVPEGSKPEKLLTRSIPLEDIGIIILDHPRITLSMPLIQQVNELNIALITCDTRHMPAALLLPIEGHTLQQERFRAQLEASEPLRKQLWAQTIKQKIKNQGFLLSILGFSDQAWVLNKWSGEVSSGDKMNLEARAAALYWKTIFSEFYPDFTRDRIGGPGNDLLNYGYAIVRATVARSLVGSGLLPTLGIHHSNRYNAYALADDIMEPFRIYVDRLVYEILKDHGGEAPVLDTGIKARLLELPAKEVLINGQRSPMMVGLQRTTSSLASCFEGEAKRILYPELV
ncbi:type II CRISPR-associated endonuclease Cas1 [Bacteroidota bacterium]